MLNFGQISVISRKRYKIETCFQWKTNRKSYVAYRMAPMLVTLKVISQGHSPFAGLFKCNPSHICAVFYQISNDSSLARSSATAGFLVFISDVAWKDYLRKTACVWLCGYRHNPLSTTLPLSSCGAEFFGLDLPSYRNSSIFCWSSGQISQ